MLCNHCNGVGFFWKVNDETRQTTYGQDLNHRAISRGDTCPHCHGSGEMSDPLTLTAFGWCLLLGLVFGLILLGQFWPDFVGA
jgi:hypothetical protein